MPTDIEIAEAATLKPITEIGAQLGLKPAELIPYGHTKAKVAASVWDRVKDNSDGKLILMTAMSPTRFGEGKTTTSVGLGQALGQLGKKALVCIREPSLGPVFGIKGGAAGGGHAQVVPMADINLHFTGDLHAIGATNNLLAALIDNHIHQGNLLRIDARTITWRRVMDMNDRALRSIVVSLGGKANGFPREDGFDITVASEVMAILCLSTDLADLKKRLAKIVVAADLDGNPVTAAQLKADGAMAMLLRDALQPNLVQTLENTPAMIHGGPFANIAHGCSSLMATRLSLKLADYVVTEAGFGSDLGAEKFMDIKCRFGGIAPSAAVIVANALGIKHQGGGDLSKGLANLGKHIENMQQFGLPVVVSTNRISDTTEAELAEIKAFTAKYGVEAIPVALWEEGGKGGLALAKKVAELVELPSSYSPLYELSLSTEEMIETIATRIYGAVQVNYTDKARKDLAKFKAWGFEQMPVCIAKTPASLTDDATILGRPEGFTVTVREVRLSAGAGFFVVLMGDVMTMPGLGKTPAAEGMSVDDAGRITGLA